MASKDKVDELVIELTARDKATEKIDNLAKSLRGLGDSLTVGLGSAKLNSVASSIKSISGATQELGRSTRAINNIPKLTTELTNMMNSLSNAPAISKDVLSLAHALSKIDGSAIKGFSKTAMPQMNTGSATQEMQAIESEAKKVDSQTKEVTQTFNNFGSVARSSLKGISSLFGSLGKVDLGKINNGLNKVLGKVGSLAKKVGNLYKSVSLTNKLSNISLKKGFTTLLRYTVGIRSLFVLANRIRSAIEEGNKNLAQYSDTFNKSMSRYKSGLGTLKNAMSVAFAPLVNYFSSAVNKILDSFINAFNTIARLMGRLTGAKQVVQATRYYDDFGKSLGTASKNAKDLTTGIDELNILNDNSGSGGGGASTDVQDMFETVEVGKEFDSWINKLKDMWDKADFTELGTALADKINKALQDIDWKTIHKNARKLGKSLATFLNGIFEEELNGQSLGYTIGYTIGQAINTGIEFAYAFVTNFHWDSFGQSIADLFKGALETVKWKKLGKTFSKFVNGFLTTLITFFSDKKLWQDLGKAIGDFFSGIDWKETWFNVKQLIKAIAGAIKTALVTWAKTDPKSFGIATAIGIAIAGIKVATLVSAISGTALATTMSSAIVTAINVAGGLVLSGLWMFITAPNFSKKNLEEAINNGKFNADASMLDDSIQAMKNSTKAIDEAISETQRKFSGLATDINTQTQAISESVTQNWESISTNTDLKWSEIVTNIRTKVESIKINAETVLTNLKDAISTKWAELKTDTSTKWNNIKDDLATKWTNIKQDGYSKFLELKNHITTKWVELKTDTSTKWSNIKDDLATKWTNIKTNGTTSFNELKTNIISAFEGAKTGIKAPINGLIGLVEGMVNKVVDGFNAISDAIKDLTTFEWTNPITGTVYTSNGISLPKASHISIPRLADGGYVPNTNTGSLFWAGENGAEVVAHANGGTEVLNATQVADAVSSGVRQAIIDAVTPYMIQLVNSNQAIADKDTSVNIGDIEIARANRRGSSQLGLQLITS